MSKRLNAIERRASIIAVAKILFADKGFHGVSVDEIARRLGVSPAVLYQHFESKQALYEAVIFEMADQRETYIEVVLNGPDDFASVLLRMSLVFADSVERDPDFLRMEMQSALENEATTQQLFINRWKDLTDYIEFSIRELKQYQAVNITDARLGGLIFKGMMREILYSKCVIHDPHYRAYSVKTLVGNINSRFLNAIGYVEPG